MNLPSSDIALMIKRQIIVLGILIIPHQVVGFSVSYKHVQKTLPKEWSLPLDAAIDEMVERVSLADGNDILALKELFRVLDRVNRALFQQTIEHPGLALAEVAKDFALRLNYLDFFVREWGDDFADQIYAELVHLRFMAKHDNRKVAGDGLIQLGALNTFLIQTKMDLITLPHLSSAIHDDFSILKKLSANVQSHVLSLAQNLENLGHKMASFTQGSSSQSLVFGSHEWYAQKAKRPAMPKHWLTQIIDSLKYYVSPSAYIPERFLPSYQKSLGLFYLVLVIGHEAQAVFHRTQETGLHISEYSLRDRDRESLDVEKALIGTILKDKYHLISNPSALAKLTRRHPGVAHTLIVVYQQLNGQKPSNDDIFRAMEYHQLF